MISAVTIVSTIDWYPFRPLLESLAPVVDEIVVNVDAGAPKTLETVYQFMDEFPISVSVSAWNWAAKDRGGELARQTNLAINRATHDWILDVQADELLHEDEHAELLRYVQNAPDHISGFQLDRLYFFGRPDILRTDWTVPLTRLFRKGSHTVVGDAMGTQTLWGRVVPAHGVRLYHYSRLAPGNQIVDRIMSLSRLFHEESTLERPETYDWKPRLFDTFSSDNRHEATEVDPEEVCVKFNGTHPRYVRSWLRQQLQGS